VFQPGVQQLYYIEYILHSAGYVAGATDQELSQICSDDISSVPEAPKFARHLDAK
jgi:hypothetical protein